MVRFFLFIFLIVSFVTGAQASGNGNGNGIEWFAPIVSDTGSPQYEAAFFTPENCVVKEGVWPFTAEALRAKMPLIAIVIDDVGVDYRRSKRTIVNLPAAVTLSFLPYAQKIQEQVDEAVARGHQVMLHMPMEADRNPSNPGPDYLGAGMSAEEVRRRTEKNLSAFTGYVGVNNHMGSKATRDRAVVDILMDAIRAKKIFFLDSMTSPSSVAWEAARDAGLFYAQRNVFIDHVADAAHVLQSLRHIEAVARRNGTAIAIGHPKDVTLDALEKWIPTLESRGFRLVPVSQVIDARMRARRASRLPSASP